MKWTVTDKENLYKCSESYLSFLEAMNTHIEVWGHPYFGKVNIKILPWRVIKK